MPFQRLELPYGPGQVVLPPEEVYLLAEAEAKTERKTAAAEFAEAVGSVALETLTVEAVTHELRQRGTRPEVLALIDDCLEAVQ